MYNLLVGFSDGAAFASRLFEYTDVGVKSVVAPGGGIDVARLMSLPTLLMPEIGSDAPQVARVGRIEGLFRSGADYRYRFIPDPGVPQFSTLRIQSAAVSLGIADFEFNRTLGSQGCRPTPDLVGDRGRSPPRSTCLPAPYRHASRT